MVAVERIVFYRERAAGMYSTFPYSFAQVPTSTTKSVLCNEIKSFIVPRLPAFHAHTLLDFPCGT